MKNREPHSNKIIILGVGLLILIIYIFTGFDWLRNKITIYSVQCEGKCLDNGCEGKALPVSPDAFFPNKQKQYVLSWSRMEGFMARADDCVVINKRNWECKNDEGGLYGLKEGRFFGVSEDFCQIPRYKWLYLWYFSKGRGNKYELVE